MLCVCVSLFPYKRLARGAKIIKCICGSLSIDQELELWMVNLVNSELVFSSWTVYHGSVLHPLADNSTISN